MKVCQYCKKEIPKSAKKCPECGKWCYKIPWWIPKVDKKLRKRNKEIVKLLESGRYTLSSVGALHGISRERVRQLYRKVRKKPYTDNLLAIRRIKEKQKEREHQEWLQSFHFTCGPCGKPVTWGEAPSKKRRLCNVCKADRKRVRRSIDTINICEKCGKEFHPYANNKKMRFCSNPCYFSYKSAHPEEFGHRTSHRVMSTPSVSPSVIFRINGKIVSS